MAKHTYRGRRRRHPMRILLSAILLIAAAGVFLYWSNHSLVVEEFTYVSQELPAGFAGCTIVQLSDLHGAEFGDNNCDLLEAVRAAEPDYIFLTGDLLDQYRETPGSYAVELCEALVEIAPVYYVTGNHEWALKDVRSLKEAIAQAGVTVLSNAYTALERNGDRIILAGIDDPNGFADQKTPEQLRDELYEEYGDCFWLLLAHRNNYFAKQYAFLGADLTISGHAHGGLFRLPYTDGLIGVERDLFPSYTAGFYEVEGADLFVSRGLGNSGRTFRIFNRPQVAVLTLERG